MNISEKLIPNFEEGDSSLFHTHEGGLFVNTETGYSSIISEDDYPTIIVHGVSLGYNIRKLIFEGNFTVAVESILIKQWNRVHVLEILGALYHIILQTPGSTKQTSIKESVTNAESIISKATRYAQMPVRKILSVGHQCVPGINIINSDIENIEDSKTIIHSEVQRYTQILLNVFSRSPSLDGALRLYTIIFIWCSDLPVELFIKEITALQKYVQEDNLFPLKTKLGANKHAAFDGMITNYLLRKS